MMGFAEKTFKYVDTNNTKRLVDWMVDHMNLEKKTSHNG